MNAQAITQKIIDEARALAAETLREASVRVDGTHNEAQAEADRKHAEAIEQTDRQVVQMRERMLRMAELDQKKVLLKVKRDVIDEVFVDALRRLTQMDGEKKKDYFEKIVLQASEDGEEIIADANERALFDEKYIARLNAALHKAGKRPVALSEEARDLGGGFVLRRGGLEINCTYASVLNERRTGLEADVAAMLFEGN